MRGSSLRPAMPAASVFSPGATLEPGTVDAEIAKVKALSDRPFGVNFHMFQPNADEVLDAVIRHRVRAVSYGRGPEAATIKRLKDAGILCMPTIGAVKHCDQSRAARSRRDHRPRRRGRRDIRAPVPTTILLPQVLDAVKVPVVAAGGFFDGRGLAAALAYGASGIAMGTRFLMTSESPVPRAVLDRLSRDQGPDRHPRHDRRRRPAAALHRQRRNPPPRIDGDGPQARHESGLCAALRPRGKTRCARYAEARSQIPGERRHELRPDRDGPQPAGSRPARRARGAMPIMACCRAARPPP